MELLRYSLKLRLCLLEISSSSECSSIDRSSIDYHPPSLPPSLPTSPCVTFHKSHFVIFIYFFGSYEGVKLVGEGFVFNGAYSL